MVFLVSFQLSYKKRLSDEKLLNDNSIVNLVLYPFTIIFEESSNKKSS